MYSILTTFILFAVTHAQNQAQFYYSPVRDSCQFGTTTLTASNNTANGGLCAYVPSTQRLYACPAPEPTCWTQAATCNNKGHAGSGQNQCNSGGTSWCCGADETCPTTDSEVNICMSIFSNIEMDYTPEQAQALEYAAIPSSKIGTASVTATPTPFYVMPITAIVSSTSLPTSIATSTQSQTDTTSTPTSDPTNIPNTVKASSSSSPTSSPGFIAGIAIGGAGIVAAIVVVAILLCRRHRLRDPKRRSVSTLEVKDYSEFDSNPFTEVESQRLSSIFTSESHSYESPASLRRAESETLLTQSHSSAAPTEMSQVYLRPVE